MKKLKKIMLGMFVLMCSYVFMFFPEQAKASETVIDESVVFNGDEFGVGMIAFSDSQLDYSRPFGIEFNDYSGGNGNVTDNGVRLRKKPSLSATVLELMYNGENVLIDYIKSYENGFDSLWFYVKRIKTGTWGWVKRTYIAEWN